MHIPSLPRYRATAARLMMALFIPLLIACGGGSTPAAEPTRAPTVTPQPEAEPTAPPRPTATPVPEEVAVTLVEATFAKSLSENQEPVDPTESFFPDETIYISLEFDGRPESGEVSAQFYWRDEQLAEASVDLGDANSGVIFSIGQSTFAGFNLTHEKPLPISRLYRVEAFIDGEPLGTYPFAIVAGEGALDATITDAVLALGADESYNPIDPTTEFATDQKVFLVGYGDFSQGSWLEAEWYINGELDSESTRILGPVEEESTGIGFSFSLLPEAGWEDGEHEVVLSLNDEQIGTYTFTVGAIAEPDPGTTSGALPPLEIGELVSYAYDTALFTIDVPADWEFTDRSSAGSAAVSWVANTGFGAIFINIYADSNELTTEALGTTGEEFVTDVFGSDPGFTIVETTPQSDGSVLVAWTSEPVFGEQTTPIAGLTYVEQRGDKVSVLTAAVPRDQYTELWESSLNQIVNSYRIDPSADLP